MRWEMLIVVTAALASASAGCRSEADALDQSEGESVETEGPSSVEVVIRDTEGREVGRARLTQGALGLVIHATFEGLPPGAHAFHLHETGVCQPSFASAGGHLTWPGSVHGILTAGGMHVGDLPNVHVPESGSIEVDAFVDGASLGEQGELLPLLDGDGAALVLHAGADDYRTDPAGNAGDRIACGVVSR